MRVLRSVPLVLVRIDLGPPEWFVVDTGSPVSIFVPRIAPRILKHAADTVRVGAGNDEGASMPSYSFEGLRFGDQVLRDVNGVVMDLSAAGSQLGVALGGVLGFTAFENYLLTLDYPGRRVVLSQGALPDVDQHDVLFLTSHELHPSIALRIAGESRLAEIDSGSGFFLQVPTSMTAELPFRAAPVLTGHAGTLAGVSPVRSERLETNMTIGQHVVANPIATVEDGELLADGVVRIGGPLLAHFAVTLDQQNLRARFVCHGCDPIAVPAVKSFGIGFVRGAAGWQIATLLAGAKKPDVDLAIGDRLVSLDGRDAASLDPDALDPTDRATGSRVPFVFERQTRRFAATVPVSVLVR